MYDRYDIIDEEDMRRTVEKVQEHLKNETEKQKVVPIRRLG